MSVFGVFLVRMQENTDRKAPNTNTFHVVTLLVILKVGHSSSKKERFDYKDKVNIKIHDVTTWLTNNYNTHIAQSLTK